MGNFFGALLAELLSPSGKVLNWALHAAAGLMLAIVAIEVMPEALENVSAWLISLMFFIGGCLYLAIDKALKNLRLSKTWMIYAAVAADLIGDGLLIGTSSAISIKLGLILACGQVLADIPEGFAVSANFQSEGMKRSRRIGVTFSLSLFVIGTALIAFYLFKEVSHVSKMSALVLTSGMYCLASVEDLLNEAHSKSEDSSYSSLAFILGFSAFILLSNK